MEKHPHHFHINFLLVIILLLLAFLIILSIPAFRGYKLTKQFEEKNISLSQFLKGVDTLNSELIRENENFKNCNNIKNDLISQLSNEKNITYKNQNEILSLKSEINKIENEFNQKISNSEDILNDEKAKYTRLEESYLSILENAANNICCKAKVDNKDIDSYIISNDRIVCTTGGDKKIVC